MEEVDRTILEAVGRGDRERAAVLIFRHISPTVRVRVLAWLRHDARSAMDAEDQADDVTQDAGLALLDALERGKYEGRSTIKGYAIEIARHMAFRGEPWSFRKLWAWWLRPGEDADAPVSSGREMPWDECDARKLIDEMLEHLDRRQHILLSMRLERMETAVIARALRTTEGNVRTIESRTVAKLREMFTRKEDGRLVLDRSKLATKPGGRRRPKG